MQKGAWAQIVKLLKLRWRWVFWVRIGNFVRVRIESQKESFVVQYIEHYNVITWVETEMKIFRDNFKLLLHLAIVGGNKSATGQI